MPLGSSSVFEGVEKAARRLRDDVLGGLWSKNKATEEEMQQVIAVMGTGLRVTTNLCYNGA